MDYVKIMVTLISSCVLIDPFMSKLHNLFLGDVGLTKAFIELILLVG